ncbi:hypothetical protein ElyMa_002273700 [Elysia marginata]|uniref:Secreted protein n=1 Tax=Elysia marginata TaxID=1093978 RepID=A0AAV4G003_9GAST|nr:hypothetical protein ElyMa_002273700 [Elysia marginata]
MVVIVSVVVVVVVVVIVVEIVMVVVVVSEVVVIILVATRKRKWIRIDHILRNPRHSLPFDARGRSQREAMDDVEEGHRGCDGNCKGDMERGGRDRTR